MQESSQYRSLEEFETFVNNQTEADLKQAVLIRLCSYINQHALDPRQYGYWFSKSKIILFSLQQVYYRANCLAKELNIDLKNIKVEISGQEAEIKLNYLFKGNTHQEVHAIANYCVMESSLYDFLKPHSN